jgi:Flp pilus assembly protein TadD
MVVRSSALSAMGDVEAKPFLDAGERGLAAGEYAAAEQAFARAVELAPDSAMAHSKHGVTLAHLGRIDDALAEFSRAIALAPGYAPAYSNLGNVYREKGLLAEAVAAYERAVAIDPDYWIVHQNLGGLYKRMGRVSEAVAEFKKATRLSVRQPTPGARRGCLGTAALMTLLIAWLLRVLR